jgi:hypothetical protein
VRGPYDPLFHIARAPLPANSVQSPELRLVGVSVRDGCGLADGIHINSLIGVEGSGHEGKQLVNGLVNGGASSGHSDGDTPEGVGHRLELVVSPWHWYWGIWRRSEAGSLPSPSNMGLRGGDPSLDKGFSPLAQLVWGGS